MSKHEDGLMPCLFSRQGMSVDNIKFFRGEAPVIAIGDFRGAFCDAEHRKTTSTVSPTNEPPLSGVESLDVRAWLDSM